MTNIILKSISIIILSILIISIFIWIITTFKFFHFNSKSSNISNIFIIIIVVIFIIFFPLILIKSKSLNENFNSSVNYGYSIQYGTSGITPTGTINFDVPFQNTPQIFTQINGNQNTSNNVYSIQIFNVTNSGFSYAKNLVTNSKSGQFTIATLNPSTVESFNWIAFG